MTGKLEELLNNPTVFYYEYQNFIQFLFFHHVISLLKFKEVVLARVCVVCLKLDHLLCGVILCDPINRSY